MATVYDPINPLDYSGYGDADWDDDSNLELIGDEYYGSEYYGTTFTDEELNEIKE